MGKLQAYDPISNDQANNLINKAQSADYNEDRARFEKEVVFPFRL